MKTHLSERLFQRNDCGKDFAQGNQLKYHMRSHTSEKRFCKKYILALHITQHSVQEKVKCTVCHRHFRHEKSLKRHMVIHTVKKKYLCDVCGKLFAQLRYFYCT